MSGSASIAALKGLVRAFNDHDLDRIMDFFAEDAVLEMPRGPDPWGRRFVLFCRSLCPPHRPP